MARNFTAILATLFVLLLGACTDGEPCDEAADCVEDTACLDCEARTGFAEVVPSIDGVREECTFEVDGVRYFTEDGAVELPVGEYEVRVGNPELPTTSDGYLRHVSNDGREWVSPDLFPNVTEGRTTVLEAPFNRYFAGDFDCGYDIYTLSSGEFERTTELDRQWIEVLNTRDVRGEDDSDFDVLGASRLYTEGSSLRLDVDADNVTELIDSEIGSNFFTFTVEDEQWDFRAEVVCQLTN